MTLLPSISLANWPSPGSIRRPQGGLAVAQSLSLDLGSANLVVIKPA